MMPPTMQAAKIPTAARIVIGCAVVAGIVSIAWPLLCTEIAIRWLQLHGAAVDWITDESLLAGHPSLLPEAKRHYQVTIHVRWSGGNPGLAWLKYLPRLKNLRIVNAHGITDAGFDELESVSHIEKLALEHLDISDRGLAFLRSMTHLKQLELNQLPVTDEGLAGLSELTELEILNLGSLKSVGDRALTFVERLPRLRELVLGRTAVSDAGLEHLNRGLESLNLFETQITDDGIKWLEPLSGLTYLNLSGTHLTDDGLTALARLPELDWVAVGRTGITQAGVDAFKKRHRSTRPTEVDF
jgi:hypothetical protein